MGSLSQEEAGDSGSGRSAGQLLSSSDVSWSRAMMGYSLTCGHLSHKYCVSYFRWVKNLFKAQETLIDWSSYIHGIHNSSLLKAF